MGLSVTELRIGNWVEWNKVASMGVGQVEVSFHGLKYHDFLNPIPLTEEWLEKFGFNKWNTNSSETWSKGILILHKRKRGWVINKKFIEPKYVHQLQNLYHALTGEELTIKE